METLSRYLTEDHEHCDTLFAEAENAVASGDWAEAGAEFARFRMATLRHFLCEEDILFPAFESATGMTSGPTMVMRSEHEQIRLALEAMAEAVAARNAEAYLGYAETLLMLLRQHNLKEEQILYPMTDRAMAGETPDLLARMQALVA